MIVSISNENLVAKIQTNGAELISLINNATQEEIIWKGNPLYWEKHSPILFPIVGSLKNNAYTYNDKIYKMLRHGFARDIAFETISKAENNVTFKLLSSDETKLEYPFDFELLVSFELIANSLEVSYSIKNIGNKLLPFSIGGHPAFALNDDFENYSLAFRDNETISCFKLKNFQLIPHNS